MSSLLFFNTMGLYTAKYQLSQSHVCSNAAGSLKDGCFVTKERSVTPRWRVSCKRNCKNMGLVLRSILLYIKAPSRQLSRRRVFSTKLLHCSDLCFWGHPGNPAGDKKPKAQTRLCVAPLRHVVRLFPDTGSAQLSRSVRKRLVLRPPENMGLEGKRSASKGVSVRAG